MTGWKREERIRGDREVQKCCGYQVGWIDNHCMHVAVCVTACVCVYVCVNDYLDVNILDNTNKIQNIKKKNDIHGIYLTL